MPQMYVDKFRKALYLIISSIVKTHRCFHRRLQVRSEARSNIISGR